MRTLTIDMQGLSFSVKILLTVGTIATLWFTWLPLQQRLAANDEDMPAFAVPPLLSADEHQAALDRLLHKTENEADGLYALGATGAPVSGVVRSTGRFVTVDLNGKRVSLYEDREQLATYHIAQVPVADSVGALTQGTYTVDSKEEVELSTLTMMRFPYYVAFGDRFAFHGVATDANGNPLEHEYAGGSIELAPENARDLFMFAKEGIPVYVREGEHEEEAVRSEELAVTQEEVPATSAQAFALRDLSNGQVFLLKNGTARYPIASITKLITAVVASDIIGHGEEARAPNGQYYTLGDLYYPLLLRSDNGVAQRLAQEAGTERFVAQMNAHVRSHNLTQSVFADSSGLSPRNVSSAHDLALLAQHLYDDKRYLLDISSEESVTITSVAGVKWSMQNQNKLASDPHFRGGKLGYTDEAGQTSLAIFNIPLAGETRPVAVIVLGSKDWKQDTRTLLRWLLEHVSSQKP